MPVELANRFTIRPYERGDEAAILQLFERSFHVPRTVEHWKWKYEDDPYGARRISLAFDGGRLVAHYAGYPTRFILHGREIEANQIGDTMTDVSIRHIGRGPTSILGRTALHFYGTFCENAVAFNYGFNVANIQKFSLKFLRSERVEPIAYRVLETKNVSPISRWERLARGIQLELTTFVSREWDDLFRRLAPKYGFLLRRDARYVRWRYLDSPDTKYAVVAFRKWRTLVGWAVFRIRENRLTIGDLLVDPDHLDTIDVAIRHLSHVYPVDIIEGWFPDRPRWLDETLQAVGFQNRSEPQDLSVMCVPFALPGAAAEMRRALYYTMGDGDLF